MLASGTCVIAITTSDEIVIGADSFSNIEGEKKPRIVCKLGIVDDIVFATAGLSQVFDDETFEDRFNVREIVRAGLDSRILIEKNLDQIIPIIQKRISSYYALSSKREEFVLGLMTSPIEIALCRYEEGALKLSARRLTSLGHAKSNGIRSTSQILSCRAFPDLPEVQYFLAGSYDAICRNFEHHRLTTTTNLVDVVRHAIQIQIAHDPCVGGPIRVIQVTRSGIHWRMGGAP
jgi:hypothetical protein